MTAVLSRVRFLGDGLSLFRTDHPLPIELHRVHLANLLQLSGFLLIGKGFIVVAFFIGSTFSGAGGAVFVPVLAPPNLLFAQSRCGHIMLALAY